MNVVSAAVQSSHSKITLAHEDHSVLLDIEYSGGVGSMVYNDDDIDTDDNGDDDDYSDSDNHTALIAGMEVISFDDLCYGAAAIAFYGRC